MHKYSTQTANTLALRIRAAKHRYVLICDKNALPFEMSFFPILFLCCSFFSSQLLPQVLDIFVYLGRHCVVITIIRLLLDNIALQRGENPLVILKK